MSCAAATASAPRRATSGCSGRQRTPKRSCSITPDDLPGITAIDTEGVRAGGIEATVAAARPAGDRRYWVFTDVDVLDPGQLTVDAPQPDGLTWGELTALLAPLVCDPRCLGLTLACYNPDLDADGSGARRVVELLAAVLPV